MKKIHTARGISITVDDDDYDMLMAFGGWWVRREGNMGAYRSFYAMNEKRIGERRHGKKIKTYMHRLIMNARPEQVVLHLNGDTVDNRKENLELVHKTEFRLRAWEISKKLKQEAIASARPTEQAMLTGIAFREIKIQNKVRRKSRNFIHSDSVKKAEDERGSGETNL